MTPPPPTPYAVLYEHPYFGELFRTINIYLSADAHKEHGLGSVFGSFHLDNYMRHGGKVPPGFDAKKIAEKVAVAYKHFGWQVSYKDMMLHFCAL